MGARGSRALWQRDTDWSGFAWLNVDDADRSSIAFLRVSDSGEQIVCICNFTPMTWELQIALPGPGTLHLALDSDAVCFGGAGARRDAPIGAEETPFAGSSHSAMVPLPPLSCAYYRFLPAPAAEAPGYPSPSEP